MFIAVVPLRNQSAAFVLLLLLLVQISACEVKKEHKEEIREEVRKEIKESIGIIATTNYVKAKLRRRR